MDLEDEHNDISFTAWLRDQNNLNAIGLFSLSESPQGSKHPLECYFCHGVNCNCLCSGQTSTCDGFMEQLCMMWNITSQFHKHETTKPHHKHSTNHGRKIIAFGLAERQWLVAVGVHFLVHTSTCITWFGKVFVNDVQMKVYLALTLKIPRNIPFTNINAM